jgi:hypothetical protein
MLIALRLTYIMISTLEVTEPGDRLGNDHKHSSMDIAYHRNFECTIRVNDISTY